MNLFVAISLFISLSITINARSVPNDLLMVEDNQGNLRQIDLDDTILELAATPQDVTYYFYTRDNRKDPVIIENNSLDKLENFKKYFVPGRKQVFVTHGWNNDYSSPVNTLITDAVLSKYDVNVFVVNWGGIANKNYFTARYAVPVIGETEADFIDKLVDTYNLSYKDFILIGHSLGAHAAGIAGSKTKDKVDHIIGLDPAFPLFVLSSDDEILDKSDANYVEVIHTSHLGFQTNLGHSDFYPNGGTSQPGCSLDVTSSCAHGRSYIYFADSISKENFVGVECDNYRHFKHNKCEDGEKSMMGRLFPDETVEGTYYLNTNSEEPYAEDI